MFERIEIFDKRYAELNRRLYEPDVAANPDEYQKVMKEIKSIEEIVLTYRDYKAAQQTERDSLEILNDNSDSELKELAQLELDEAKETIERLSEQLKILLLPKDPNDERNVIVEIRGGAGGEESALFSAVLFRMYSMYAEKRGYKIEIIKAVVEDRLRAKERAERAAEVKAQNQRILEIMADKKDADLRSKNMEELQAMLQKPDEDDDE